VEQDAVACVSKSYFFSRSVSTPTNPITKNLWELMKSLYFFDIILSNMEGESISISPEDIGGRSRGGPNPFSHSEQSVVESVGGSHPDVAFYRRKKRGSRRRSGSVSQTTAGEIRERTDNPQSGEKILRRNPDRQNLPASQLSFIDVETNLRELGRPTTAEQEARRQELLARKNSLMDEARAAGLLEDINQAHTRWRISAESSPQFFDPEVMEEFNDRVANPVAEIPAEANNSPEFAGLREYYHREQEARTMEVYRIAVENHHQRNEQHRQESLSARRAGRAAPSTKDREQSKRWYFPNPEEVGPEGAMNYLMQRLTERITSYKDERFDMQLARNLDRAIDTIAPRPDQGDIFIYDGAEYSRARLIKTLKDRLVAVSHIQEFIVRYRNVSKAAEAINGASYLNAEVLNNLIHIPEVAVALRVYERIGTRIRQLKDKTREVEDKKKQQRLSPQEKEELSLLVRRIKELMITDKGVTPFEEETEGTPPYWAYRIAGGLYSAFQESARHDVEVVDGGDYFAARVLNLRDRVQEEWKARGRRSRPRLYEAFDLEYKVFWRRLLEKRFDGTDEGKRAGDRLKEARAKKFGLGRLVGQERQLSSIVNKEKAKREEAFQAYCRGLGLGIEFDVEGNLDLSEARFEEMSLVDSSDRNYIPANFNEIRLDFVDIADAEAIRTVVFAAPPDGAIVELDPKIFPKVVGLMKHLKGAEREEWIFRLALEYYRYFHKGKRGPAREIRRYRNADGWRAEDKERYLRLNSSLIGEAKTKELRSIMFTSDVLATGVEVGQGVLGFVGGLLEATLKSLGFK
jgi:hypothetical protein